MGWGLPENLPPLPWKETLSLFHWWAKKSVLGPGEGRLSVPRLFVIQILKKYLEGKLTRCAQTHGGLSARVLLLTAPRLHCPLKCLQQCLAGHSLSLERVFCRLCLDRSLPPASFYSEVTPSKRPFHTAPQSLEPHDPLLSHISLAPLRYIINIQLNYGIFVCINPPHTHTHIGLPL